MNQKINRKAEEIERTKAKIAELQALLPELEREKANMENSEVIRLMRSADIAPGDVAVFVETIRKERQTGRSRSPGADGNNAAPAARQEVFQNDEE
jgi:hypothetical protein